MVTDSKDHKYTEEEKRKLRLNAIRDGGFYGPNGVWNSIVKIPGDSKLYRKRVETLIIRNKSVFLKKKPDNSYFLPGGSTEKDVPDIDQAAAECREEARMDVDNLQFTNISYATVCKSSEKNWSKDLPITWDGCITDIYVGEYVGKDKDDVDDVDKDPFIQSGRFYPFKECAKIFSKEHNAALRFYINYKKNEKSSNEETVTESYISNYFKNKRFLKQISKSPEVQKEAIENIIEELNIFYYKKINKPDIKKEMARKDVAEIFHPVCTLDFPDKTTCTIAVCFDKDEFSPGVACPTGEYGDLVIVYPKFFKDSKDNKIMTLLHEIGHIRLAHLDANNRHREILGLFGKEDSNEYRLKLMRKNKAMYPEKNADLYAVLNGAKMYTILSTMHTDMDSKGDYRLTHGELANRYTYVLDFYNKYLRESAEYIMSNYDVACFAIYEFVYSNPNISSLSLKDKKNLYSFLYETVISNNIDINQNLNDNITFTKNTIRDLVVNESTDTEDYIRAKDELESLENEKISYERQKFNELIPDIKHNMEFLEYANPEIKKFVAIKSNYDSMVLEAVSDILDIINKRVINETATDVLIKYKTILEAATKRSELPDSAFGVIIDGKRKYPLDTKKHVYSAIKLFGHIDPEHEEELAKAILKAMREYGISTDVIGPKNKLRNYI